MRVHQTLICFFFLNLTDGFPFHEDIGVREGTEGGNIEVGCSFKSSGSRKVFCRKDCEDEDILCNTTDVSAQCGRYSIELRKNELLSTVFYVSITNLRKSDSGSYTCWLGRDWTPDSSETFELRVKDATTTSKPNTTPKPSSTRSTSTLTTAQTVSVSSGSTTTSSHSSNTTTTEQLSSASGSGPPVQTEYAEIQENNRVYEEIREGHRSPVVEVSTVYSCAKFAKPNGVETTDDYSLLTAAGSHNKTVDDSSKLNYSEVDFSNSHAASRNSAPSGGAKDDVIYSVPRAEASSENTLYCTGTLN
ncbi:T-cell immunoglobulin and mucin domain-containing protein 4-like isoform X2 [Labrus mixtus]|uniref:T-cell immunoglobulin and mucin domain-containing protein 4-like isoform X2 n=1 Tax=Labrus mixtus TaxID=508554 RepID=UPI0029C0441E|nr:T-cell immunoglobulin and mucin domain-containing protein 4-like isoform X2 [Labrus mixtus]